MTGINDQQLDEFVIFPNPVAGNLIKEKLDDKYIDRRCSMSLTDMYGNNLGKKDFIITNKYVEVEVGHLTKGFYLLDIKSNNQNLTHKLRVIENLISVSSKIVYIDPIKNIDSN